MNFLNKMERKFGRYAIPELTKYIILCYVIGYALEVFQNMTGVGIMGYLALFLLLLCRIKPVYDTSWTDLETGELGVNSAFRTGYFYNYYAALLLFTGNSA